MRALTVCQGTVPADYYDAWIDEVLSDNRLVKVVLKWLMYIIIINLKKDDVVTFYVCRTVEL